MQTEFRPGQLFQHFEQISADPVTADNATFRETGILGKHDLRGRLRNPDLSCSQELNWIGIVVSKTQNRYKSVSYTQLFITSGIVQEALDDFFESGFYASISSSVRTVSHSASYEPAHFDSRHPSVRVNTQSSAGGVVRVSTDDHVAQREVAVNPFDRRYTDTVGLA